VVAVVDVSEPFRCHPVDAPGEHRPGGVDQGRGAHEERDDQHPGEGQDGQHHVITGDRGEHVDVRRRREFVVRRRARREQERRAERVPVQIGQHDRRRAHGDHRPVDADHLATLNVFDLAAERHRADREPDREGGPDHELDRLRQRPARHVRSGHDLVVRAGPGEVVEVGLEVDGAARRQGQHHDGDEQADHGDVGGVALPAEVPPGAPALQHREEHDHEAAGQEDPPVAAEPVGRAEQARAVLLDAEHAEEGLQRVDGQEGAVDPVVEDLPEREREAHDEAGGRMDDPGDEDVLTARPRVDRGEHGVAHAHGDPAHGRQDGRPLHRRTRVGVPGQHDEDEVTQRDLLPAVEHDIVGFDLAHQARARAGEDPGRSRHGRRYAFLSHCVFFLLSRSRAGFLAGYELAS